MMWPLRLAASALAALSTVSGQLAQAARFAGSTTGGGATSPPALAGGSTGERETRGSSPGTLPGPATAAAASSTRTGKDGRSTRVPYAAAISPPIAPPGSRWAALELLDGFAGVLAEEANGARDWDVAVELNRLMDAVLDAREEIE